MNKQTILPSESGGRIIFANQFTNLNQLCMKIGFLKSMLFASALLIAVSACEKDNPVPALPYEDVFGQWEWLYTALADSEEVILADSVDYTQTLEITQSGEYIWSKADSTIFESAFEVVQDTTAAGNEEFIFQFDDNSWEDQTFYVKNKDTLLLNEDCAECDSHVFIRK